MSTPHFPIYMDYSATNPCDPRVVDAMIPWLREHFGNPASRSHAWGWEAEKAVETAREQVAALIGADPREIVWTSGATESNNLAIKGAAHFYQEKGKHLITAKTQLSPNVTRLDVQAPRIAEIRRAGQFVIVRRGEGAERIPLTIADSDPVAGTITLVIQAVGKSTRDLVALEPGALLRGVGEFVISVRQLQRAQIQLVALGNRHAVALDRKADGHIDTGLGAGGADQHAADPAHRRRAARVMEQVGSAHFYRPLLLLMLAQPAGQHLRVAAGAVELARHVEHPRTGARGTRRCGTVRDAEGGAEPREHALHASTTTGRIQTGSAGLWAASRVGHVRFATCTRC